MKLSLKHQGILSVLHNQYHACWCSGDFWSQCISRHGIDPQSRNISSPAWEELRMRLSGIWIKIQQSSLGKLHLKMSSEKMAAILSQCQYVDPLLCCSRSLLCPECWCPYSLHRWLISKRDSSGYLRNLPARFPLPHQHNCTNLMPVGLLVSRCIYWALHQSLSTWNV